ncbi:MAG: hypothetical protein ACE5SW_08565 [Nitrososphaeraceae archaeon]
MNSKIKTGSMFLLAAVLVVGTISMTIPSSFAQSYAPDPYAPDPKSVNVQKIKCVNSNVNVNGVDVNQFLDENGEVTEAQQLEEDGTTNENGNENGLVGDGGLNIDRNLLNICLDINANGQASGGLISGVIE